MGAATADEFSIAKNVESVVLQAIGVGEFSKSMLTQAAKLKESNSYVSPRSSNSGSTEEENAGGGSGSTTTEPNPDDSGSGSTTTNPNPDEGGMGDIGE